jgi:GNAT superfamily N-acetyltransferase
VFVKAQNIYYNTISSPNSELGILMKEITFRKAAPDEMDKVLLLLKEAALWLHAKNIDHWQNWIAPAPNFVNWIQSGFDNNEFFMIEHDGIIGCFRLQWQDPQFWGQQEDNSGYIHSFTIKRELAGQGIGYRLLNLIEAYCWEHGKTLLRLDCGTDVPGLRKYYEKFGFKWVKDTVYTGFPTTLYEKPIRRSTEK